MVNKALSYYKTLGVIFLALLVLAVYLTYAVFTQKFTHYDKVMLSSDEIGLQLPERADVKVRGVIVGEVLSTKADGGKAQLTLGIKPSMIHEIPANVGAQIIPKTLFGEKYVDLLIPKSPEGTLEPGDRIQQAKVSTEVEAVLSNLYPLLNAVQPQDLAMTLSAISDALDGRGNELGQALQTTDDYLKRMNPQIPQLLVDLRKTAQVSEIYNDALPSIAATLDNTVLTTTTLRDRSQKLRDLFNSVTGLSGTLQQFLSDNESNLVELPKVSTKQLRVFSRYSTEFPCLLKGIVKAGKYQAEAFRGFELHIVLETLPRQPRGYDPGDRPIYGETRGPNCLHLPNSPYSQSNPVTRVPNFKDGVNRPTGKGTDRVAPGFASGAVAPSSQRAYAGATSTPAYAALLNGSGFVGSPAETDLYRRLVAPSLGVAPSQVGDLAALLAAPMARGAEVTLK